MKIFEASRSFLFFLILESDLCMRLMCGQARGFQLHIVDNAQRVKTVRLFVNNIFCCYISTVPEETTLLPKSENGNGMAYLICTRLMHEF